MSSIDLIDAERLEFARLVTEAASLNGGRSVEQVEIIGSGECLFFVAGDVNGFCVVHSFELPAGAWTPALESHLVKLFSGSASLALRSLGGTQ